MFRVANPILKKQANIQPPMESSQQSWVGTTIWNWMQINSSTTEYLQADSEDSHYSIAQNETNANNKLAIKTASSTKQRLQVCWKLKLVKTR